MPSPRKRRVRRAQGAIMGTQKMSAAQKADAHFVEQLVRLFTFQRGSAEQPFVDGGNIKSIKPTSGLIASLSDLDMFATQKIPVTAQPAAHGFIQLKDATGAEASFVFKANADQGATGSVVADVTPTRYRVVKGADGEATWAQFKIAVEAKLDIAVHFEDTGAADDNAGTIHLQQKKAGVAGNTSIVHGDYAAEDSAAKSGGSVLEGATIPAKLGGGCSVLDATCKHYYHQAHQGGAAITSHHGCVWVENPLVTASSLPDDLAAGLAIYQGLGEAGDVSIDPAAGQAADRLHIKAVASGVALNSHIGVASVIHSTLPGIAANLNQAGGNVALGQTVNAGNQSISISTDVADVATTGDFLPHTAKGCVVHFYFEDLTA